MRKINFYDKIEKHKKQEMEKIKCIIIIVEKIIKT